MIYVLEVPKELIYFLECHQYDGSIRVPHIELLGFDYAAEPVGTNEWEFIVTDYDCDWVDYFLRQGITIKRVIIIE